MSGSRKICAGSATVPGIDVSLWQREIDWRRVGLAGVRFAFIKVSEGVSIRDPKFATNWRGAAAAGLYRGAYVYFRPHLEVRAQVELALAARRAAGGGRGELPVVLDVEEAEGLTPARVVEALDRLGDADGRAPIVYASPGFWVQHLAGVAAARWPLWVAHWNVTCPLVPPAWPGWVFHQHSATGRVDGISTDVDLNRFNGGPLALRAFAAGVGPRTFAGAGLALGAAAAAVAVASRRGG